MLPWLPPTQRESNVEPDLQRESPTLRLYHVGEGQWWLLDYKPRPDRMKAGRRLLRRKDETPNWSGHRMAWCMAQGYTHLGTYEFWGEVPRDLMLNEVRVKLAASQADLERAYAADLADSDGSKDGERFLAAAEEFRQAEGKWLYRRVIKQNPVMGWRK